MAQTKKYKKASSRYIWSTINSIYIVFIDAAKYTFILLLQILATLLVLGVLGLFVGSIFAVLGGAGALLVPVAVNQGTIIDTAGNAFGTLDTAIEVVFEIIDEVWRCLEPLLVLINIFTEFFLSLAKRVTAAIPGVQEMFTWARMVQMERVLSRSARHDRAAQEVLNLVNDAKEKVRGMTPTDARIFLKSVEARVLSLPNSARYRDPEIEQRFVLAILEIFCDVVELILGFVIDVLDILFPFVLDLAEFILDFFYDPQGGLDTAFEVIFVRFIIDVILEELGFAECFEDLPAGLIICLCPWRYDEQYSFPGALDLADDAFPDDLVQGIIGCFCPRFDISADDYSNALDYALACFYLDELIDLILTVVDFIYNTLLVIVNGLVTAFNAIKKTVNDLIKTVKKLVDIVDSIFRDAPANSPERMALDVVLRGLVEVESNFAALKDVQPWHDSHLAAREVPHIKKGDAKVKHISEVMVNGTLESIRLQSAKLKARDKSVRTRIDHLEKMLIMVNQTAHFMGNTWRRHGSATFAERIVRRLDRHPQLSKLSQRVRSVGDGPTHANFGKIIEVVHQTLGAAAGVLGGMSGKRTREEIDVDANRWVFHEALEGIDFEGAVQAIQRQARHVRMQRGDDPDQPHPLLRSLDAGLQMTMASLFAKGGMPHVANHLIKKYGNETLVAEGAGFAARVHRNMLTGTHSLAPMEDMRNVLRDLNVDDTVIAREIEEQRAEARNTFNGRMREVRENLNEAWEERDVLGVGSSFVTLGFTGTLQMGATTAAHGTRVVAAAAIGVAPVLVLAPFFLMEIINIILTAGTGTIIAATSSDNTPFVTQSWSPVTPYIKLWGNAVINSFQEELTTSTLNDLFVDTVDLTEDQLFYVVNLILRSQLGKLPLPLGALTSPPLPVLDTQGQPTQDILDYLTDWFYCDPTRLCADYDSCGANQPCRCPTNPFAAQDSFYRTINVPRQRSAVDGNPCRVGDTQFGLPRGRCLCHPFIPIGQTFEAPETDFDSDIDCRATYGFDTDGIQWWKVSRWTFVKTVFKNTVTGLRIIVRYILFLEPVNEENIFVIIIAACPCACLLPIGVLWSQIALVINATFSARDVARCWLLDFFRASADAPLLGNFFEGAIEWVRDPTEGGEITCLILNSPSLLVGISLLGIGALVLLSVLLTGGWITLIIFFIRVVLFVLIGLPVYFFSVLISVSRMTTSGLLDGEGAPIDPENEERRAVEITAQEKNGDAPSGADFGNVPVKSSQHLKDAGLAVHSAPVEVGNRSVVRRRPNPMRAGGAKPWRAIGRAAWRMCSPDFVREAWVHNPVDIHPLPSLFRASGRPARVGMHRVHAVYDEHTESEEFPTLRFAVTENNVSVLEDPNYAVCDTLWLHGHRKPKRVRFHGRTPEEHDQDYTERELRSSRSAPERDFSDAQSMEERPPIDKHGNVRRRK